MRYFIFFNTRQLPLYLLLILPLLVSAQESPLKVLDHDDFDRWKTLQDAQLSSDGAYISYRLVPGAGDPVLNIYSLRDSSTQEIARVSKSSFTYDGKFIIGTITPHRDSLRALERIKVDKKKWPSDTLFILELATGTKTTRPYIASFKTPAKANDWLAYTLKKDAFPSDSSKEKKNKKEIVHLIVRQLSTGHEDTLFNVKEYTWAEKVPALLAYVEAMDSTQAAGVYYLKNHIWKNIKKQKGEYSKLSLSPDGNRLAFIANHDTTKALIPPYQLYYHDFLKDSALVIAKPDTSKLMQVSQHATPDWSDDSRYLYYGRATKPWVKDTSLLEDESVNVEIWSTSDPVLYTIQNVERSNEEKKSFLHVYDTQTKKHIGLGSVEYDRVVLTKNKNTQYALVYTDAPYQREVAWMGDAKVDIGMVDIHTGQFTLIKKGMLTTPRLSPGGQYVYGYSDPDSTWWAYHIPTQKFSTLAKKGLPSFYDEENDVPNYPNSYGTAGWLAGDAAILINDRYDIWSWAPASGNTPVQLTFGRSNKKIHRWVDTDRENDFITPDQPWLIHITDEKTKSTSYAWYTQSSMSLSNTQPEPYAYSKQVIKARNANVYMFTRENFQEFPNLRVSKDELKTNMQISDANPQQKEYKWGTIELYEWIDWDSTRRTGLLVKPVDYDPMRTYPTIVNFYERNTQTLHAHPNIEPHRSTINYAFYASRGYVIFNPDITYKIGYPGESAYQIVMSGVESLVKNRIADPNILALQGHSWGGYQIAYILTRTDVFKCAEAGASVVNMTSAYGGIRWGSGLSRQFQYELQQSRIGKTLWDNPQLYITNSPLFKINKITTPLLLMHNDEDAAVPFEQGIEFYLALRRLDKKAWLLNYRGEPHWPVKYHNRRDFQLRMSQFFDHYLMGKPMPRWMSEGVPAIQRGINAGY